MLMLAPWWVKPVLGVSVCKVQDLGPGVCLMVGEWSRSWAPLMGSAKFLGVWELKGVDGI